MNVLKLTMALKLVFAFFLFQIESTICIADIDIVVQIEMKERKKRCQEKPRNRLDLRSFCGYFSTYLTLRQHQRANRHSSNAPPFILSCFPLEKPITSVIFNPLQSIVRSVHTPNSFHDSSRFYSSMPWSVCLSSVLLLLLIILVVVVVVVVLPRPPPPPPLRQLQVTIEQIPLS